MEDRESLCTIFFSADARPEFQQLLEKIQERKNENLSVLSGKPYIRPEINAGIRPYTRLIDVEEVRAVMKQFCKEPRVDRALFKLCSGFGIEIALNALIGIVCRWCVAGCTLYPVCFLSVP